VTRFFFPKSTYLSPSLFFCNFTPVSSESAFPSSLSKEILGCKAAFVGLPKEYEHISVPFSLFWVQVVVPLLGFHRYPTRLSP
jgi:hypothetical protein